MGVFRKCLLVFVCSLALLVGSTVRGFAAFPEKPIKVIVPFGVGGTTDIVARTITKGMEKHVPVPIVVVSKSGAGGMLGAKEAKESPPDGYTMLIMHIGLLVNDAIGQSGFGAEAFEALVQVSAGDFVFTVPGTSPYKNMTQVLAAAAEMNGTMTHATNLASSAHIAALQLMEVAGVKFRFVQVTGGGGPRIPHMVGGHSATSVFSVAEAMPYHKSGDMRILAIMANERWPELPDVPTTKESGLNYDPVDIGSWFFAPKGTPADRVDYLVKALEKSAKDPETLKVLDQQGFRATFLKGEALGKRIEDQDRVVKALAKKYKMN